MKLEEEKMKKISLILIAAVALMTFSGAADKTKTEKKTLFLGEFCAGNQWGYGRAAVTEIGYGHYLLNGVIYSSEGELQNVQVGSAYLVDGKIRGVMTSAGNNANSVWNGVCSIIFDGDNFSTNSTFECIGHDYNKSDLSTDHSYSTGTSTPMACP
jgi:hypothetical protein